MSKVGIYDFYPKTGERKYEQGRRFRGETKSYNKIKPVVTIITVVYNNEKTIQRCIDSVVNQTYTNIEYIVIDGASSDKTLDIIKKNVSNVDYVISERDKGIYHAMNKGIALAKGDFIAMINSDDWLELDGIEKSVNKLLKNNADVLIGFANVWNREGKFSHIWKIGNFDSRILMSGMSFCHQAVIASKEAYEATNLYDEEMKISSDYKWVKELFLNSKTSVFLEEPIVNFSFDGVSANNRPIWKEECKEMLCDMFTSLRYEDVSSFLEYIYRDQELDKHAIENIINDMSANKLFLKSLSLVLLDKLSASVKSHDKCVELRKYRSNSPKISVIIPVYNVERYIDECLLSVVTQSFKDIEIIIVDDGSPDKSIERVLRFMQFDPRIRVIEKENGGLSSARNTGFKAARGEYIHFLDSDDYISNGMYEELYNYAADNKLDIVKSNLGFINNVYPIKKPVLPDTKIFSFSDCPQFLEFISPCASLYRKKFLEKTSLFPEGITYEDRPFNWETIIRAKRIGHVDKVFYMYRVARPDSIMNSNKSSEKHFDAFKCIDLIAEIVKHNSSAVVLEEFVKEQLRLYSMLIDIKAIPDRLAKKFFDMCSNRLEGLEFAYAKVDSFPIHVKHKILFRFLTNDIEPTKVDKYKELSYYINEAKKVNRPKNSCELFEEARAYIDRKFNVSTLESAFNQSLCTLTAFDDIHGSKLKVDSKYLREKITNVLTYLDSKKFKDFLVGTKNSVSKPHKLKGNTSLIYRHSNQINYVKTTDFINLSLGDKKTVAVLTNEELFSSKIKEQPDYNEVIDDLVKLNVNKATIESLLASYYYAIENVIGSELKLFFVLFSYSPFEVLLNFLKSVIGFKTVFIPHGLPQRSFTKSDFDYVFSFTNDYKLWKSLYPNSIVVQTPWAESYSLESKDFARRKGVGLKRIAFLSQISGAQVHRLSDLKNIANDFIEWAVNQDSHKVDIRLRNESEKDLINPNLVCLVDRSDLVQFTTMTQKSLAAENYDLIVSVSSTGLLHAQHLSIPSLKLTTEEIESVWPFQIATTKLYKKDFYKLGNVIESLLKEKNVMYNTMKGSDSYMKAIFNNLVSTDSLEKENEG